MKYYRKDNSVIELNDEETAPEGFQAITEQQYTRFNEIVSQLCELRFELKKTDYQAIKHSEGWISDEDYAPIKEARQAIRNQINELEAEL